MKNNSILLRFFRVVTPKILDDIRYDLRAIYNAYKVARSDSAAQSERIKSYPTDLENLVRSSDKLLTDQRIRMQIARFGYGESRKKSSNLYSESLNNMIRVAGILSKAEKRPIVYFLLVFLWLFSNTVLVRHFSGGLRRFFKRNFVRVKERAFARVYNFFHARIFKFIGWVFYRVIFIALVNLLFLGPVKSFIKKVFLIFYQKLRTLLFFVWFLFRRAISFSVFLFSFLFLLFGWPFVLIFYVPVTYVLMPLVTRSFLVLEFLTVVGFLGVYRLILVFSDFFIGLMFLLLMPVLNFVALLVVRLQGIEISYYKFLNFLPRFSFIWGFRYFLARYMAASKIRIYLKQKKTNPIRRFSVWLAFGRYKLLRYQQDKVYYVLTQLAFTPIYLYNLVYLKFKDKELYHRLFWRNFLGTGLPTNAHAFIPSDLSRMFSYFSVYDDFTLTNFFSKETAFPLSRYLLYEVDDWSSAFEASDVLESDIRNIALNIRTLRLKVLSRVRTFIKVFTHIPDLLWSAMFRFAKVPLFFYKTLDFFLLLLNFLATGVVFLISSPPYVLSLLFSRVKGCYLTLMINFTRVDRYGVFTFVHFIIVFFLSLWLLLEFFFFFGIKILIAQEFLMRNFDPLFYNGVFFIAFVHCVLSFFFPFFSNVWREARYPMIIMPFIVTVWLSVTNIKEYGAKFGYRAGGPLPGNPGPMWFNEALHSGLVFLYLYFQPALRRNRFVLYRPVEASETDVKQFTFDFVTSLF